MRLCPIVYFDALCFLAVLAIPYLYSKVLSLCSSPLLAPTPNTIPKTAQAPKGHLPCPSLECLSLLSQSTTAPQICPAAAPLSHRGTEHPIDMSRGQDPFNTQLKT